MDGKKVIMLGLGALVALYFFNPVAATTTTEHYRDYSNVGSDDWVGGF